MGNDTGSAISTQAKDAKGNVVQNVFFAIDSRHVTTSTTTCRVCTQISTLGTDSQIGAIRFAEITSTVPSHFKLGATKASLSGTAAFAKGDGAYLPANVPKVIDLADNSFIGTRAAVGQIAGTLHITLLI